MILEKGDKVCYIPYQGADPSIWENGIVKSGTLAGNEFGSVFVVFKCDNDWENYMNYTGSSTKITDLKLGWVDKVCFCASGQCSHCYPASDDIIY